jgi:ATP phosphoribosyltransferase
MQDSDKSVCTLEPNQPRQNALFAIPKKGRLYDRIVKLLTGAGLDHHRPNRLDVAQCTNLPVTLVFLPAADIATYVAEGNVDCGITGLDVVKESGADVEIVMVSMPLLLSVLLLLLSPYYL